MVQRPVCRSVSSLSACDLLAQASMESGVKTQISCIHYVCHFLTSQGRSLASAERPVQPVPMSAFAA